MSTDRPTDEKITDFDSTSARVAIVVSCFNENVTSKFSNKMLEKGIMITSVFYPTFAHKQNHFDLLNDISNEVFKTLED